MGDRERLSRAAKGKAFDHASGSFLDPEAAAALEDRMHNTHTMRSGMVPGVQKSWCCAFDRPLRLC